MSVRKALRFAFLAALLLGLSTGLLAEGSRYALVIGNGNYADFCRLSNPVNDAADIANALKGLGFKVVLLTDANRRQMNKALNDFHDSLAREPTSAGFFWYAGHGVQSKSENYLLPVGAQISREVDLEDEAVSVRKVSALLDDARNQVNVVVLDACRNNPLAGQSRSGARGLTVVSQAPAESVIMYSTGAGQVAADGAGRNSPFAQAFLKYVRQGGDIMATVKAVTAETKRLTNGAQVPYLYSSLTQDFAMNPKATSAAPASAAPSASAPASAIVEDSSVAPTVSITTSYGKLIITAANAGALYIDGKKLCDIPAGKKASIDNIETGARSLEVRYDDGLAEKQVVNVEEGVTAIVAFTRSQKPAPAAGAYKLGDRGPSGGLVFFDKGKVEDGWRYLEAAPTDAGEGGIWGSAITIKSVRTPRGSIDSNRQYMETLVAALGGYGHCAAAKACYDYKAGEFTDWFLPTKDQLDLMYKNLKKAGLGRFASEWYWSSTLIRTTSGTGNAVCLSFGNGSQANMNYEYKARIRAVRAF
jgi:hypothetical protein